MWDVLIEGVPSIIVLIDVNTVPSQVYRNNVERLPDACYGKKIFDKHTKHVGVGPFYENADARIRQ